MQRQSIHPALRISMLLSGILILAWSFNSILSANHIVTGGLAGFSILLKLHLGIDPSLTQWTLGIPIFLIGWAFLGKSEILNSIAGALLLPADGAHSGENKSLILTVVPRAKVGRLRRNIRLVDPTAFTIISDASEVLGYGFQNHG